MPMSRCPVVRLQSGWAGAQGFTTDYHAWPKDGGPCTFCGVTRRDASTAVSARPRLGWRGLEVFQAEREFEEILAARPRREGPPYNPDPQRWASVTSHLRGDER